MTKSSYFLWTNIFLLLIVLIGFSPSFYLRPSSQEPLPWYLIIHGISCTAWFMMIVLQAALIRSGKVLSHKKLGIYFSLLAPIIVLSGLWVISYVVEAYHADFPSLSKEESAFKVLVITGDFLELFWFLAFVYVGYKNRTKIEIHKRAMLIASILITQQALVRIGKIEMLMIGDKAGASGGTYATLVPILLFLSLLVYDKMIHKQFKRISLIGLFAYLLFVISALLLSVSGISAFCLDLLP